MCACGLSLIYASLSGVVGLLGPVKRALLARKVRISGIALGSKVLDRSRGIVIRLVGLIGLCLGGIVIALCLRRAGGSLGGVRLAFGELGVSVVKCGLRDGRLVLGGVEICPRSFDVNILQIDIGSAICRLRDSGGLLRSFIVALGSSNVTVRFIRGTLGSIEG